MRRIIGTTLTALALAGALAACSSSDGSGSTSYGDAPSADQTTDMASPSVGASTAELKTAETSLGTIVVDGKGMTAYYFDKDTANSGKSVCTGECAANWPAIVATSETPTVEGVTAEVGTITGVDGKPQITIDGRPVYLFAGDSKAGDVAGQGVGGVWYVVAPDGTEMKDS
jgi:predicted lipoprotein with Yx(FWY)xxD motif